MVREASFRLELDVFGENQKTHTDVPDGFPEKTTVGSKEFISAVAKATLFGIFCKQQPSACFYYPERFQWNFLTMRCDRKG